MRRRAFLAGIPAVLPWIRLARAESASMPVIGFLSSTSPAISDSFLAAFRAGLKEVGYVEGDNVAVDYRWADGHFDRLPALAAELVARRVAVIAAGGPPATVAAKAATATVPIVFLSGEVVERGFVQSLNRPGGNATGVSTFSERLWPKRLELITELAPNARLIAVLAMAQDEPGVEAIRVAAPTLGRDLLFLAVRSETEIAGAFRAAADRHAGAILVSPNPFFTNRRDELVELAARHKLPAVFGWPDYVRAGGLASYGASLADAWRQVGVYAGRILKGANPADLPVQQDTRIELFVNLATARALGLALPQSVLARADEVIE